MQTSQKVHVNPLKILLLENSSLALDCAVLITGNFQQFKRCLPQAQVLKCRKVLESMLAQWLLQRKGWNDRWWEVRHDFLLFSTLPIPNSEGLTESVRGLRKSA